MTAAPDEIFIPDRLKASYRMHRGIYQRIPEDEGRGGE